MKKVLAALVILLFLALTIPMYGSRDIHAQFLDANLETVIRFAIGKPQGPILIPDLKTITTLDAQSMDISALDGMEHLDKLTFLNLRDNQITDLSPLSGLTNLVMLDLRDNGVTSIWPLTDLKNLLSLNLRNNQLVDLTGLEGIKSLRYLNFRDNRVQDISPLASLTQLMDLNARNNLIQDIGPLAGLSELTRRLYISGNPIRDYRPVEVYYDLILDIDFDTLIPDPQFSVQSGFFTSPLELELTSLQKSAVILYTLDGSVPSPGAENTRVYTEPISIGARTGEPNAISDIRTTYYRYPGPPTGEVFKATVVRAQVFQDKQPVSPTLTHTYFIGEGIQSRYSLPVISIVASPEHFFDPVIGIYVPGDRYSRNLWTGNYFGLGEEWERPAHLEYFEPDGSFGFSQDIGVRVHGGITRAWPQKTLRLYARAEYGQSRFNYQLFPAQDDDEYKRLLLRNSGNDIRLTFFRDALIQTLIRDTTLLDIQDYQPAVVFINGEYWGLHNMRERLDDHYLARKYGVEREQVRIVKVASNNNHSYSRLIWDKSTTMSKLSKTIAKPEVYAHINTLMDVENYIDYMIIQIYVANTDWPRNNMRYWRLKTDEYFPDAPYGLDGRWRWMVYDTDYGFGLAERPNHNTLKWAEEQDDLLNLLLKNETFSNLFVEKFTYHINNTFNQERVLSLIDEFQTALAPEMAEHINRWPIIDSVEEWEENIDTIRAFAIARPEHMLRHLQKRFNLSQ